MHSRNTILLAVLLTLTVQTALVFAFQNPVLDGQLNGADSYMRLHRVLHLYETGNWYDGFNLRTNAPYGELIHWTRPLDSILFAGAWIGSAVTEFPNALFIWGVLVGPALLITLAPIWSWGTRPLLGPGGFLLSFALFPLLGLLNATFRPGNPDHHGLIALFFLTLIAIFIRLSTGKPRVRIALAAGLVAGASIWVGVVEVFAATYFGTALALLWLWRGKPYDRYLSGYIIGLVVAITVALAIERPPSQWLSPFYERLSFVHWFVVVEVAVNWFVIRMLTRHLAIEASPRKQFVHRLATLTVVGALTLITVGLLFPPFFQAPMVDAGSPLLDQWLGYNLEFVSLWPVDRASAQLFFTKIGPTIIALGYMIWRWRAASAELRNLFAVLMLGYFFYLPLALNAIRWVSFVQALTLLPLVMVIVAVWRWEGALKFANQRIPLRSTAVTVVIFGPLFAAAIVAGTAPSQRPAESAPRSQAGAGAAPSQGHQRCDVPAISAYLDSAYEGTSEDDILFTYLNWGSEIIWRTPYNVVGAPYTNLASLTDTSKLFHATSDRDAADIVRRRGIDLFLVCVGSFEQYPNRTGVNLHNRMVNKRPPQWLEPVDLPADLAPTFRLYRVNTVALPS
jgi:hypothetical protein